MLRKLVLALGMVAAVAFTLSAPTTAQDKKKVPAIKQIMAKMNGKKGLVATTGELSKAEKWDAAMKSAKAVKEFGAALGMNKPKKGDAESWEKLSKAYAETAKMIFDGVEAKDLAKVEEGVATFNKACKTCHSVHK